MALRPCVFQSQDGQDGTKPDHVPGASERFSASFGCCDGSTVTGLHVYVYTYICVCFIEHVRFMPCAAIKFIYIIYVYIYMYVYIYIYIYGRWMDGCV